MIKLDPYLLDFLSGNTVTISLIFAILKSIAVSVKSVSDNKITTLIYNIINNISNINFVKYLCKNKNNINLKLEKKKMKKIIFLFVIILAILTISIKSSKAEDDIITIDNKIFITQIDNYFVVMYCKRGPFGPGEGGTCDLYTNGIMLDTYQYTIPNYNLIKIYNIGDFLLEDNNLNLITRIYQLQEWTPDFIN